MLSGDPFSTYELIRHVPREIVRLRSPVDELILDPGNVCTEPHLAHVLDPSRHTDIDRAGQDQVCHHMIRLL